MPTGKMIGSKNCWFHDTSFRHPQGQLAVRIRATGRDDTLTEHRLRCGGRCVDDPTCKSAVAVAPRRRGKLLKTPTSTAIRSSRPRLPRVQGSDVAKPEGIKAPTGQFGNVAKYPPADFRLVSAPNADTLYSVAWLDLSEPQVFSHPDMGDRYFLFEVVNLWMSDSESSPSKRTAGGATARNGAAINCKPAPGGIASHIHPSSAREPNGRPVHRRRPAPVRNKPAAEEQDVRPGHRRAARPR